MSQGTLFRQTVENLLRGDVICPFSTPELHAYLKRDEYFLQAEDYLAKIGRGLARTRDSNALYAVYSDITEDEARKAIRGGFERLTGNWEMIMRWLALARHGNPNGHPVFPGDTVRESDLLAAIEQSSSLQEDLDKIATSIGLKSKSREPRQRLAGLFDRFVKDGYLIKVGVGGSIYRATGRWSILYDQLEFVAQQEGILEAQKEADQSEMPTQGGLLNGAP